MLIVFSPRRLAMVLTGLALLLGALSLTLNLIAFYTGDTPQQVEGGMGTGFRDLVSVSREANLPTWFSSVLLLIAAAAVGGVSAWAHRAHDQWRWHWSLLAVVFVYLSIDELARLHERANHQVSKFLNPSGIFAFGWWVLAAPLVAAFALGYLRFLRGLPQHVGRLMVLAGTIYVGGAIGMELVGSWLSDAQGTMFSPSYILVTTAEEVLEMLGVVLFLYTVTTYANSRMTVAAVPAEPAIPPARPVRAS